MHPVRVEIDVGQCPTPYPLPSASIQLALKCVILGRFVTNEVVSMLLREEQHDLASLVKTILKTNRLRELPSKPRERNDNSEKEVPVIWL